MKCIRFILIIASVCSFHVSQAQLAAYINGKEIKSGAMVSPKDLPSLQVSFKKPKDVTVISGASVLYVDLRDQKDKSIQQWYIEKDGYVAIDDFLKHTPAQKKFRTFGEGDFHQPGNTLDWTLTSAAGQEVEKTIQVKVGFYVVEETGYRTYGPQVQLLEPIIFNVPVWETKKLYLPYLDLTVDKTNITNDFNLEQSGPLNEKGTELGYRILDNKGIFYSIYALSSDDYPGLNPAELANDFLHEATMVANPAGKADFKNYDNEKYSLPWENINGVRVLTTNLERLHTLSSRVTKDIKKIDMMTLLQPAEVNGLKGYMFSDDIDTHSDINSSKWSNAGKFLVYFLSHPSNPKLTLVVSSEIYRNGVANTAELDTFLKTIINGIKQ